MSKNENSGGSENHNFELFFVPKKTTSLCVQRFAYSVKKNGIQKKNAKIIGAGSKPQEAQQI